MKAQAVRFQRGDFPCQLISDVKKSDWEVGIAIVKELGLSDVIAIIDKNGNLVDGIWNYKLMFTPLSYIDTNYWSYRFL